MKRILIVLGAENSDEGKLGAIAQSRLDKCVKVYKPGDSIIYTGGWGAHFNATDLAHAVYAQKYLKDKGDPESCFLPVALSAHTVDDAVKVKEILNDLLPASIVLISTDVHLKRVQFIFDEILKGTKITYDGVKAPISNDELVRRVAHEKKALKGMMEKGLYY